MTKAELEFLERVPMYLQEIAESLKVIADSIKKEEQND